MWLPSLGPDGMIFPPAPSLRLNSPGKPYHKYLSNTVTSMQEMFKKHDAHNRENNEVLNLILHLTKVNVNTKSM